MKVFIGRSNEQLGSWSDEEVRHYLQTGNLIASDYYWHEGMPQWDKLGNFPLPAPTPAPVPAPVVAVAPVLTPATALPPAVARSSIEPPPSSRLTWFVPFVLAFLVAIFVEPVTPVTNDAAKVGEIIGGLLILLVIAIPVSFLFRDSWRVAVRCGLILLFGTCLFVQKVQRQATKNWLTEVDKFGREQAEDAKKQIARDGFVTPDPKKLDHEIQKLHDLSRNESDADKKLTDFAIAKMKDISTRGLACRAAEQPMLALAMSPSQLTSLDEIDKRRTAVQAPEAPIENFIAYLTHFDTNVRAELISQGTNPAAADKFIQGMDGTGKIKNLLTYWQLEDAILNDLLANLDILKKNWGQWKMAGDTVDFQTDDGLAAYQANIKKLNADIALQKTAQAKVLDAETQPAPQ